MGFRCLAAGPKSYSEILKPKSYSTLFSQGLGCNYIMDTRVSGKDPRPRTSPSMPPQESNRTPNCTQSKLDPKIHRIPNHPKPLNP